jgi:murein DD-endopeptidase MepM/ murein hydrolase activator NlpD
VVPRRGLFAALVVAALLTADVAAAAPGRKAKEPPPPPTPLYEGTDPAAERAAQLAGAVTDLDTQLAYARSKVKANQEYLGKLVAYEAEWNTYVAGINQRIDGLQRTLNRTVVALYRGNFDPAPSMYSAIIGAGTARQAEKAALYITDAMRRGRRQVDQLRRLKAEAEIVAAEAAAKTAEVKAVTEELASGRKQLEGLRSRVAAARKRNAVPTHLTAAERKERQLLAQVQAAKEQYLREIALLQAESSAIAKWLRGVQAKQRIALRRRGTFQMPATGRMSSGFGPRTHPVYGDTRIHTGVDISAPTGTAIHAAGPGKVLWAGPRGGYGNMVVIDHGNGLATLYAHQSKVHVAVDQIVATGDHIGDVGSTGLSTGPHLHFEVREKGSPLDPHFYL